MQLLLPLLTAFLLALIDQGEACGISLCSMSGGGGGCCPPPPVMNSCCGGGGGGCARCFTKRRLTTSRMKRDARHQVVSLNHSDDDDPICNDAELRRTIEKNMMGELQRSTEAIHEALSEENLDHFAVICSRDHFAYLADSIRYCLVANSTTGETCYAIEH